MAGMFYTLEEIKEKLGMGEAELQELVKGGKLREFRDGAKLLYKVNEVNALLDDVQAAGDVVPIAADDSVVELAPSETAELELELEPELEPAGDRT